MLNKSLNSSLSAVSLSTVKWLHFGQSCWTSLVEGLLRGPFIHSDFLLNPFDSLSWPPYFRKTVSESVVNHRQDSWGRCSEPLAGQMGFNVTFADFWQRAGAVDTWMSDVSTKSVCWCAKTVLINPFPAGMAGLCIKNEQVEFLSMV